MAEDPLFSVLCSPGCQPAWGQQFLEAAIRTSSAQAKSLTHQILIEGKQKMFQEPSLSITHAERLHCSCLKNLAFHDIEMTEVIYANKMRIKIAFLRNNIVVGGMFLRSATPPSLQHLVAGN